MKKIILALTILAAAFTATAQTNTPASPGLLSFISSNTASANPSGLQSALGAIGGFFNDAQPYFGSNATVQYTALVLYNDKHVGGLLGIGIPLTALNANGQITAGTAIAYINDSWFTASLNAAMGTTWNVPLLGKVYTVVGSGPDYNFKLTSVGAYSFFDAMKGWDIGSGRILSLVAGVANETTLKRAGLEWWVVAALVILTSRRRKRES